MINKHNSEMNWIIWLVTFVITIVNHLINLQ